LGKVGELVNNFVVFFVWVGIPLVDLGFVFEVDGSSEFIDAVWVVLAELFFVGLVFVLWLHFEEE